MVLRSAIKGFVLLLGTGVSATAMACPQESVTAAVEKWTAVFAENNPETISAPSIRRPVGQPTQLRLGSRLSRIAARVRPSPSAGWTDVCSEFADTCLS
jgi:hypothetical protein